ncbi:MAG: thiol peroxidase [Desulfovibrionaceae bacterium]|nr:thiol peroxidase [Desulfovibrionaceae bacterium]
MSEIIKNITFHGAPLTLEGSQPDAGSKAPDFKICANDLSEKKLADYQGKVLIISTVPSLDTGVCDMATRRFNSEAAALSDDIRILVISADLPFAQARWCGAAGAERLETLSDYKDVSFAQAYGVLISELRLLARSVWVINREGSIVYKEIVSELTNEPNYEKALQAAKDSAC